MRTIGCIEVNEDDDINKQQFNIEDYSRQNNEEIERKKRQFWLICKISMCNEIDFSVIFFVVLLKWCEWIVYLCDFIIININGVIALWFHCICKLNRYGLKKYPRKKIISYWWNH